MSEHFAPQHTQATQRTSMSELPQLTAIKKSCHVVWGTDAGKQLLAELKEYYMNILPCCPPMPQLGEGYGFYREGMNEMIRLMERFRDEYSAAMAAKSKEMNKESQG